MDNKSYQDHFLKKAKSQGYRSRSAFKLIELNKKFKFLKNRINLLDLGSSPGGWCQVAKEKVKNGKIIGLDKKAVDKIKGINFLKGDFLDEKIRSFKFHYTLFAYVIRVYIAFSNFWIVKSHVSSANLTSKKAKIILNLKSK